jgi:hypothetical protein
MILVPAGVRVHIALGVTDMRKGLDGLAMLVQGVLEQDPFSGHLFAFRGRKAATAQGGPSPYGLSMGAVGCVTENSGSYAVVAPPSHISPRAVLGAIGLAGHGFCATEVEMGFAGISNRPQAGRRAISWPCGPKNRLGFDLDYPLCHWRRLRLSGAC